MSVQRRLSLVVDIDAINATAGVRAHAGEGQPARVIGAPRIAWIFGDSVKIRLYFWSSILKANVRLDSGRQIVIAGRPTPARPQVFQAYATAAESEQTETVGEGESQQTVYSYELLLLLNETKLREAIANLNRLAVYTDIEISGAGGAHPATWRIVPDVLPQIYEGAELPDPADPPYPPAGALITRAMAFAVAIPEEAFEIELDYGGLGLGDPPAAILPSVCRPSAEAPQILAAGVRAVTDHNAIVGLTAAAPGEGYILQALVIP